MSKDPKPCSCNCAPCCSDSHYDCQFPQSCEYVKRIFQLGVQSMLPDAPKPPTSIEGEEIPDDVQLSNKACRHYYVVTGDGTHRGLPGGCTCPQGRCWYKEQLHRREQGLKAVTWKLPPA